MAATPYPPGPGPVVSSEPCSRVELHISCKNLVDSDVFSKSDPIVSIHTRSSRAGKGESWTEYGRTEWIKNSLNPEFSKTIEIDYRFEEVQKLRFKVYDIDNLTDSLDDDDFLGYIECNLGEIVSSGTYTKPLQSLDGKPRKKQGKLGTITIHAEEMSQNQTLIDLKFCAIGLDKKDFLGKSDPYLEFSKENPDGSFSPVYRTQVMKNTLNPKWPVFQITSQKLCSSDPEKKIKVTCYDWDADGSHDLIGEFTTSLGELTTQTANYAHDSSGFLTWECINPKKLSKKKYKHSGIVKLLLVQTTKLYSFLDYVMAGCQINFTVGIDFTASNGNPRSPSSLHYIDPFKPNQYTSALVAVGEVCQDYDSDKLFPALGFGARLDNGQVSHEFALNGNPSNPYCVGIPGVVAAYHAAIQRYSLYGPTNFAPIINHVARFAYQAKQNPQTQQYFVLLMLTDGEITDMANTKRAIIAASKLPMSIIIVGVGNARFDAMNELDSDDRKLQIGVEVADRDIVQFVPFREFANASPAALASAVLAEIPQQVVEYFQKNKIPPIGAPSY